MATTLRLEIIKDGISDDDANQFLLKAASLFSGNIHIPNAPLFVSQASDTFTFKTASI